MHDFAKLCDAFGTVHLEVEAGIVAHEVRRDELLPPGLVTLAKGGEVTARQRLVGLKFCHIDPLCRR
ncbi:hypothetical protein [Aureimonas ureilytica]|uniref:hypothetical protein n=1 Tax=Aureimonas ureilytica TaxID=401562 RepID=UPI00037F4711|nr:hypothetical protein [Aureimonas ureilytica]